MPCDGPGWGVCSGCGAGRCPQGAQTRPLDTHRFQGPHAAPGGLHFTSSSSCHPHTSLVSRTSCRHISDGDLEAQT